MLFLIFFNLFSNLFSKQLISSTVNKSDEGVVKTNYSHDGFGNTITANTVVTQADGQKETKVTKIYDYTKDVPTVLFEASTDGTKIRYTYESDNIKIGAEVKNNLVYNFGTKKYTILSDRLGSSKYALDLEGNIAASADYNAWGEVIAEKGIYLSELAGTLMLATSYTGYAMDRGTGLWDAGARMYDAINKRFVSRDPESGNVYETERINRYIFCGNEPVNTVDPDGRYFRSAICGGAKVVNHALNYVSKALNNVVMPVIDTVSKFYESIPTPAKIAIGALGLGLAYSALGPAALVAFAKDAAIGGAIGGAIYSVQAAASGTWNGKDFAKSVGTGMVDSIFTMGAVSVAKYGPRYAKQALSGMGKSSSIRRMFAGELGEVSLTGKGIKYGDELDDLGRVGKHADDFDDAGKVGKSGNTSISSGLPNRSQALNLAKDRAGVPRSQQPSRQWRVGDDINMKGHDVANYRYDPNTGSHGRYYEYDTPNGKRVVAEHINDGMPHVHAGLPKGNPNSNIYDFKNNRYQKIDGPNGDHHIYYK